MYIGNSQGVAVPIPGVPIPPRKLGTLPSEGRDRPGTNVNGSGLGYVCVLVFYLLALAALPAAAARAGDRGIGQYITFPDTLLIQNGGPVIDIKRPPEAGMRAAKGDGVTDDTAAFLDVWDLLKREYKKHGPWGPDNSFYVYLPIGTYKVSDTLIYRGPTVGAYPKWDGTFDINHVHFVGQDRAKTIIKLADHCAGYQDPAHPKIMLAFQHPDTVFNNVPGGNWLRNLTLDTGRGNPGAVALFFQGANNTDLRSVTIRSGDGAGKYGIWFKQGSIQGYYADVTVEGFDDGIFDSVNPEGDVAFEYLTLHGQKETGILLTGGGMSLRRLRSVQPLPNVPALKIDGSGPQAVVIDSELKAPVTVMAQGGPAIEMTRDTEQCLFARDVATSGYSPIIRKAGATAELGNTWFGPGNGVVEYVSSPVKTMFPGQSPKSLRLPIEDTPQVPWYNPATQWAIVDDYPSVQAALDSGKPVVCFKQRHYKLPGDVTVPASVKFVNGMAAGFEGGAFVINKPSADPILFQDTGMPIRVEAQRNVIQRCAGGGISNPKGLPVTFFLENVNDNTTGDDFCRPGQKVYARQIDIEYGRGNQIVSNGGLLWIFGYKTENMGATPFTVKNGGLLEVLGGYSNQTNRPPPDRQNPLIRNDNGNASMTLFTNLGGPFVKAVVETRGDVTATAANTDFPKRGSVYRQDYDIPLYVGYTRRP